MTLQYGLIGYPLSHSFSPGYFNAKFEHESIDAIYKAYAIEEIAAFEILTASIDFAGINVTIPYKQSVIPYLDELDPQAAAIGAVNTIRFIDGKKIGYNTDYIGFRQSLESFIVLDQIKGALVLGTGGAARTVWYTMEQLDIPYLKVSRDPKLGLTYDQVSHHHIHKYNLIINTTPIGMYPYVDEKPHLSYEAINDHNFLYDLVYNPEKTLFLSEGLQRGASVKNGSDMLILQAEAAYQIWNL
jgi:shikimate dehydrogenase